MAVKRMVVNVATKEVEAAKAFYGDAFGTTVVMDLWWITFAGYASRAPQVSVAAAATRALLPFPPKSMTLPGFHRRMQAAGFDIEYGTRSPSLAARGAFMSVIPSDAPVNIPEHRR